MARETHIHEAIIKAHSICEVQHQHGVHPSVHTSFSVVSVMVTGIALCWSRCCFALVCDSHTCGHPDSHWPNGQGVGSGNTRLHPAIRPESSIFLDIVNVLLFELCSRNVLVYAYICEDPVKNKIIIVHVMFYLTWYYWDSYIHNIAIQNPAMFGETHPYTPSMDHRSTESRSPFGNQYCIIIQCELLISLHKLNFYNRNISGVNRNIYS